MVSVIQRMAKLRALLALRLGPGAAILPPEVTKIHMDFAIKFNDGHMGSRKFWRNCLPRLKYHNPTIPMSINRTTDQAGPALLTIHFTSPDNVPAAATHAPAAVSSTTTSTTSTAPVAATTSPAPTTRTETVNMKHKTDTDIWREVQRLTRATEVLPTQEDREMLESLEERTERGRVDSERSVKENEKVRRRTAMLAAARGELAASVAER